MIISLLKSAGFLAAILASGPLSSCKDIGAAALFFYFWLLFSFMFLVMFMASFYYEL